MHEHSYLERLRELTSEFAQEQNPLKREEILEGILSLVATRVGAQEMRDQNLTSKKLEPNVETSTTNLLNSRELLQLPKVPTI
jgi:hypothetical protein